MGLQIKSDLRIGGIESADFEELDFREMSMETLQSSTGFAGRPVSVLIGWIGLCFMAAATGGLVSIDAWYADLNKPVWNPPSWIFGPVWTLLYVIMAIAAWLVWCRGGWKVQRRPLTLFIAQLLLNAVWTPLFFGMHEIGLALIDIGGLWMMLVATVIAFWRVGSAAGLLLVPYLAWVSFAAFLNFTLWRIN